MDNVIVGRYAHPESHGFAGWVEPEDRSWILFVPVEGAPMLYSEREPDTGAIVDASE